MRTRPPGDRGPHHPRRSCLTNSTGAILAAWSYPPERARGRLNSDLREPCQTLAASANRTGSDLLPHLSPRRGVRLPQDRIFIGASRLCVRRPGPRGLLSSLADLRARARAEPLLYVLGEFPGRGEPGGQYRVPTSRSVGNPDRPCCRARRGSQCFLRPRVRPVGACDVPCSPQVGQLVAGCIRRWASVRILPLHDGSGMGASFSHVHPHTSIDPSMSGRDPR